MFLSSILIFFSFLSVFLFFRRRSKFWRCLNQIPQPPGYPFIGNLLEIVKTPENMFLCDRARALKYYPIYRIDIPALPNVNLVNPEDIELVLSDIKQNEKGEVYHLMRGWLGTGLLTSSGKKWQTRRKILTPAFHFNILQDFINIFIEETNHLLQNLEQQSCKDIDIVPPITHFTLMSIGEAAMGIKLNSFQVDQKSYKQATYEFGRILAYRGPRPWAHIDFLFSLTSVGRAEKKVNKTLHEFSERVIEERKKNFTSASYSSRKYMAMLDLLLKYRAEGAKIDDEGIREEVDTFMFEGHDTTAVAICFTVMLLANHREHQDEIYKEIEEVLHDEKPTFNNLNELNFMERFIKESLRLYPSVPFIARTAGSYIQTQTGYVIPEGCMVNIQIYDMHHNPNVYEDPETFDPDRFLPENIQKRHPFAYIPFSAGSRNCIGQKYAILEIKTVLCGILKKFILEPIDTPKDIKFVTDLVLRPKDSINVRFVPRSTL